MIRTGLILICLCLFQKGMASGGDIVFTGDYRNVSFEQFVRDVEGKTDAHFYYLSEWVSDLEINASGEKLSLTDVLNQHLSGHELSFYIDDYGNVFIAPADMVTSLEQSPGISQPGDDNPTGDQFVSPGQKYFGSEGQVIIETATIGRKGQSSTGNRASIYGKIWDSSNGEALIGATIYIEETKTGTITDVNGRYRMVLQPGSYTAQISCLGMKQKTYDLEVYSDGDFNIEMEKEIIPINEVVIKADRYQNVRGMQMGFVNLDTKKIKEIPLVMGERDLMKVAKMLPGIQTVGEGSSGFNVRGSSADQNMYYINKVPVFNTSHLFGFFSSFNPDIIKDFSLYKSNIPVEFGGRLASIFNISTRDGNKNRFTGRGGITPITGHIAVEGPIKKEKHSFVISLRSTYSDWLLKQLRDPDIRNSRASFYDLAASVNLEPDDRNLVKVFGYYTSDRFKYAEDFSYYYSNKGGSVDWRRRIAPSISSEIAAVFSTYSFSAVNSEIEYSAYKQNHRIGHYEITSNFSWVPSQKHVATFGGNLIYYDLERGHITPYGSESNRNTVDLGKENALVATLYAGDKYDFLPWLTLYGGIRFGVYGYPGPQEVYTYYPGGPRDNSNISDTLEFKSGSMVKSYSGLEIRTAANFNTGDNSSVKLSYNRIKQYLFLLSNTIAIAPTDQWKLCDYHINPPYADQVSAGFYKDFSRTGLRTSVETYYKKAHDIVEYKDGAEFITSPHSEQYVLQGVQSAYGLELMVEKSSGRMNGWISYTLSNSRVKVDGGNSWERINEGLSYPSNYDRPHALNVVFNYRSNRRLSVSTNLVYYTGRPVTYPVSIYYINDQEIIQYSKRNAYRIPDYFRVDLSFNLEGNLKAKKLAHSYWMLNFYNLTGRKNAYSVYFKSEEGKIGGYKLSVFARTLITLSWNFKFGNYASE